MGGNRHINSTSLFCFHLENVKNRMSGCKCKRSIAHGHPLLTLQLHTELITYFQPHRCDRVSQALTQPSSYLYFTLFLAQCNPGVKYQDHSPAFSLSSLLPLVFPLFLSLQNVLSNRKGCWGSKSIAAPFYTSEFCQVVMGTILKTLPKCQGKHKKIWLCWVLGFFNEGGNSC